MRRRILIGIIIMLPVLVMAQTLEIKPDKKGRLGYFDSDGNNVISCQFEEAEPFVKGVARVRKGGKYGLIDEKGKVIGGIKYTVMDEYAGTDYYIVCEGGAVAKPKDKIPTRTSIPSKIFKGSTVYPVKGAKWGIIDNKGSVVIKIQYDELSNPINGVIYVSKGGKFGFYNENDKRLVLKPTYNFIGAFNNLGVCWVKNGSKFSSGYLTGGKTSFINREGKLIIPLKFENVCTFAPSVEPSVSSLPVHSSFHIDKMQMFPFHPMPDSDEPYLWFASKGTAKPGVIDVNGTILVPEKRYDVIYKPTDGMVQFAVVEGKKNNIRTKWGFFNIETKKETFTDTEFIFSSFKNGISKATRKDSSLYYFVDKNLIEISERYTWASDFNENYCTVGRGKKYGAVDRSGREVIPLMYDDISPKFSEGLLAVKKDKKWGCITPNNQVCIPFHYDKIDYFSNGQAIVNKAGKYGIIDTQNNIILPIEWINFLIPEKIPSAYYWVKKADGLFYYYDMKSRQILFPEDRKGYDGVGLFGDKEFAVVKSSLYYGAVYRDGSECVPIKFDCLEDVDKAIFYLHKNNLKVFKEVDIKRFKITLKNDCNQHKLSDRIPEEDWDY